MHRIPEDAGIFPQKSHYFRALLRKMACKDEAFYGSSPPCIEQPFEDFGQKLQFASSTTQSTFQFSVWLATKLNVLKEYRAEFRDFFQLFASRLPLSVLVNYSPPYQQY